MVVFHFCNKARKTLGGSRFKAEVNRNKNVLLMTTTRRHLCWATGWLYSKCLDGRKFSVSELTIMAAPFR